MSFDTGCREVMTVADDEVVVFAGTTSRTYNELRPDSEVTLDGITLRTLPRRGELLCRFATVNDVHFGETVCGLIGGTEIGPVFRSAEGDPPYPEVMSGGAVREMAAIDPEAVIVKGDLTCDGTDAQYRRFLEVYGEAFGDRLLHVRGNHDSYHGGTAGAWPWQEIELPGVRVALLDTSRDGRANGTLSEDQIEWLDELASRSDRPLMVMGHHQIWNPGIDPRVENFFGLEPDGSEALIEVVARRRSIVGYFAGHTHRNRRQSVPATGAVPYVEVGAVKDYPGTWAEYRVYEGGILQVDRRTSSPSALAWTEQTRHMFEGAYAEYAFGSLSDRCFLIETTRG